MKYQEIRIGIDGDRYIVVRKNRFVLGVVVIGEVINGRDQQPTYIPSDRVEDLIKALQDITKK